jgi:hypothetical protein
MLLWNDNAWHGMGRGAEKMRKVKEMIMTTKGSKARMMGLNVAGPSHSVLEATGTLPASVICIQLYRSASLANLNPRGSELECLAADWGGKWKDSLHRKHLMSVRP